MEKSDLRESKNSKELVKYISQAIANKNDFLLWQNIEGQKVVSKGQIIKHSLEHNQIKIEVLVEHTQNVQTSLKLFIFNAESKILIKTKIKKISSHKIRLIVVDKFYLAEQRLIKRYNLQQKMYFADIERTIEQQQKQKRERVQLKDISDIGFGFYITSNRAIFFQPNSAISFNSIGGIPLPSPIKGIIKHITPVEAKHDLNNKLLLVGVKFNEPFCQIDTILQNVELNLVG